MTADAPAASPDPRVCRLLYVEDHPASVAVMEAIIDRRPGWSMTHAATVQSGIEAATTDRPDLVLLDMHLPDGPGSDLLAALKSDPVTSEIPVIVLTAARVSDTQAALLDAGAEACWSKPFVLKDFFALLDERAARIHSTD